MKSVKIKDRVFLRDFESRMIYNATEDELYEIDSEALDFFLECDGKHELSYLRMKYGNEVDYALSEGLIEETSHKIEIEVPSSPTPSLRYILVHITNKCNLKC
jgi:hypothetical protein